MLVTATVAVTLTGCNLAEDLSKIAEQTNSVSETDYDPMNLIAGLADQGESPEWVGKMQQASDADQLFVVAAVGKTTAYVSMHQKDENGENKPENADFGIERFLRFCHSVFTPFTMRFSGFCRSLSSADCRGKQRFADTCTARYASSRNSGSLS